MPSSQNNSRPWLAAIAAVLVLAAIAVWVTHRPPAPTAATKDTSTNGPVATTPAPARIPISPSPASSPGIASTLKPFTNAASARLSLADWRAQLAAMPKDAAAKAIRDYLNSKQDAATHLGFKIAANGLLDEAPTLRTFLLDELARIDPAAAADYAKTILASMDSPDEWAVALRNLASGDTSPDARALLAQKTLALLQYEPWQENPSVGYLEAFDTAVYLGGTDLLSPLTGLVKESNKAVAMASYLALDRLVINSPATVLGALEASPDLMQGHEATRADYFARADVRDPQQRQVLESYLLNPSISASELQTFAGIFPNANYMISHNLLTQSTTPTPGSLPNEDAQALAVVQQWSADPRFANLTPVLQKITTRLQYFVQQAAQGH